jgi:hypothetical protein
MARDPVKHCQNNLRYYYAHHEEIKARRRKSYADRHEQARAEMDPLLATRMSALRATPRRELQQRWTKALFEEMNIAIKENFSSRHARKTLRWAFRIILTRAEKDDLKERSDLTPAWLAGFPLQSNDPRKERIYRTNFGRMLLRFGLWSDEQFQLLRQVLKLSFKKRDSRTQRSAASQPYISPPRELRSLVRALVYRCGLSPDQIRGLRITHVQAGGLQIPPLSLSTRQRRVPKGHRFIQFGNSWDELSKPILDAYITEEMPVDYLFFSRSPKDKAKPISRSTLERAVAIVDHESSMMSLRDQHLQADFARWCSLQEARFHLRNVHQVNNQYAHKLISGSTRHEGYANTAPRIPIPVPYVIAAMCASRSVSEEHADDKIPEGGERHLITWKNLAGYEIRVNWNRSFATELGGPGRKSERVLRLLHLVAFDFWFEGRRMKLPDVTENAIRKGDSDLLDQLAMTTVTVRELATQNASWSGRLFEYGNRKRSFRLPLIEEMNRRGWHNQCVVCWHPERESIEREISDATTKAGHVKGYHLIARKYGISYASLRGHSRGRVPRTRSGNVQRPHFSTGLLARIVHIPRKFFDNIQNLTRTEITLYSLLQLESNMLGVADLTISSQWAQQRLGLRLSESDLSLALNHLGSTRADLLTFAKGTLTNFRVKL